MPQTLPRLNARVTSKCLCSIGILALLGALASCSSAPGTIDETTTTDIKFDTGKYDISGSETLSDVSDIAVSDVADASGDATTTVLPGEFSAPCKDDGDCNSGLCVQAYGGKICSHSCESAPCEPGFSCQQVTSNGQDQIYACVPKFKHLCEPCAENKDCNDPGESQNVCISFGETGAFCGATCDPTESDCPGGYTCQTVVNPATGAKVSQCKHQGICECSPKAVQLGLSTKCWVKNEYGKCDGARQCGVDGLSECSAAVPNTEECNGIDDDCNGQTDDISLANAKCKIPLNEFNIGDSYCYGKLTECTNGIAKCDGKAAAPEACNGIDDNCDGKTDEGLCEDGDPCTKDTCNTDGSCQHVQLGGMACDDGSICTQTDKCLSGKCVGGNNLSCDDNDPCTTDSCDPFVGCQHAKAQDGTECTDDGNLCTLDQCKSGVCNHVNQVGAKCTDDGLPCTLDTCDATGSCKHTQSSGPCEDGNPCTEGDSCVNGACKSGPMKGSVACDDGNPCTVDTCDPLQSGGCVHANNDFAACTSTSVECPIGQCAGGQCFPQPNKTCSTTVQLDLCQDQTIAGVCTSAGKCVPTQKSQPFSCGGQSCKSICVTCVIPVCLDFLLSSP